MKKILFVLVVFLMVIDSEKLHAQTGTFQIESKSSEVHNPSVQDREYTIFHFKGSSGTSADTACRIHAEQKMITWYSWANGQGEISDSTTQEIKAINNDLINALIVELNKQSTLELNQISEFQYRAEIDCSSLSFYYLEVKDGTSKFSIMLTPKDHCIGGFPVALTNMVLRLFPDTFIEKKATISNRPIIR